MDGAARDGGGSCPGEVIGDADDRSTDNRRRTDDPDRALGGGETKTVDQLRLLVGTEEQVDRGKALAEPLVVHLADGAAGHDDAHRRVRRLQLRELALAPDY